MLQPSSSYHLSLRSLFCLFLSGSFTQVLLYLTAPEGKVLGFKRVGFYNENERVYIVQHFSTSLAVF